MTDSSAPACSLEARAFDDRVRWISELNRQHLRRSRREGAALVLAYAPDAREKVEELTRRERECCAFLDFAIRDVDGEVELHITVPSHAADQADALLQPFVAGEASATASCCGGCDAPTAVVKSNSAAGSAIATSATAVAACGACCLLPMAFPAIAAAGTNRQMLLQ